MVLMVSPLFVSKPSLKPILTSLELEPYEQNNFELKH